MNAAANKILKYSLDLMGYELVGYRKSRGKKAKAIDIPDREFYRPYFSPWEGFGEFTRYYALAKPLTLSSKERCYNLFSVARQAVKSGAEIWDCGVYRGGTARLLAAIIEREGTTPPSVLRLFDTFEGMPSTHDIDIRHEEGDYSDTSLEKVKQNVGVKEYISWHKGIIPDTFAGLEDSRIAAAHVDVDIYQSVKDCCEFIYPRLIAGGFMIFDDYGLPSCPGAREAVDSFFADKRESVLVMPSGQAIIFCG